MSHPPPPLDHHIFISNSNNTNNTLDSGRIDLLLGLALCTPTNLSLSPTTTVSSIKHDYGQQQPSVTLSLLFPAVTQQQNLSSNNCEDISSFSNSFVGSVKRESEDQDATDVSNTGGSSCGGNTCRNKKLRLNKQQSALLEDSFKLHTTLNPKQKEALARRLNLRPRQVEVWFQNRRARTKLKQTEVDCEFLKKCCERLAEENETLQKELQHLKSLNKQQQQPFYMHHLPLPPTNSRLTASTNSIQYCPSCCRHGHQQQAPTNNTSNNFLISSKKLVIFNPFTNAC